jgi:hypothetical protein
MPSPQGYLAGPDKDYPDHEVTGKLFCPIDGEEEDITEDNIYKKKETGEDNGPSQEILLPCLQNCVEPTEKTHNHIPAGFAGAGLDPAPAMIISCFPPP